MTAPAWLGVLTGNRPFAMLCLARSTSYVGDFVTLTAVTLYLYERHESPVSLGIILAARALPQALGPIAGAVADRADPRRIMITCDLIRVGTIGAVAVTLPPFPVLVVLVTATATLSTLFLPSGKSSVPRLVDRATLGPANAALGFSHNMALAFGPVLGAFVYQEFGPRATFAIDALSYGISALLLTALPKREPVDGDTRPRAVGGLGADAFTGIRYTVRHRVARVVAVGLFASVTFAALDNVALVFRIRGDLGGPASAFGMANGAFGLAMIAAPVLFVAALRSLSGIGLLVVGLVCGGTGLLLTGTINVLPLLVLVYALAGAGNGFENIAVDTAIGEHVDENWLGRVFGTVYGPIFLAETLASLLGGPLLAATSARTVFIIAGIGVLAVCLAVWSMSRSNLRRPD